MSIADRFESAEHQSNLAHFAAIIKLAGVDGPINPDEEIVLKRLAFKLCISEDEVKLILKDPKKYPFIPHYRLEDRIERLQDLCGIIYADHEVDEEERKLIYKYALGLGFTSDRAKKEIEKCTMIFNGSTESTD